MPDTAGNTTDVDAVVALSPAEAELVATLLRVESDHWSTVTEGPKSTRSAEYNALADRIEGAIPVGAA